MFERFTAGARETVKSARREAVALGHSYVGTEHLLLGLLGAASRTGPLGYPAAAGHVLSAAGVDLAFVRSAVDRIVGPAGSEGLGSEDADALQTLGIDLAAVRSTVEDAFGKGALDRVSRRKGRHIPFDRRAKKVLELSLREAQRLGHKYIGSEHILLGLIRDGDGTGARILATKLPLRTLRDQLEDQIGTAA